MGEDRTDLGPQPPTCPPACCHLCVSSSDNSRGGTTSSIRVSHEAWKEMEVAGNDPTSWLGARWSRNVHTGQETTWLRNGPPRPVRGSGGAVSRARQPPLDPEL